MGKIDMGKMLLPNCQLCGGFGYEQELSSLPLTPNVSEQTAAEYLTAIALRRSQSRRLLKLTSI